MILELFNDHSATQILFLCSSHSSHVSILSMFIFLTIVLPLYSQKCILYQAFCYSCIPVCLCQRMLWMQNFKSVPGATAKVHGRVVYIKQRKSSSCTCLSRLFVRTLKENYLYVSLVHLYSSLVSILAIFGDRILTNGLLVWTIMFFLI